MECDLEGEVEQILSSLSYSWSECLYQSNRNNLGQRKRLRDLGLSSPIIGSLLHTHLHHHQGQLAKQ